MSGRRAALVPCPGCGRPASREALACPACGVPVMAILGPRSAGMHPVLVMGMVLAGGMFLLVLLGVVAALAVPRLAAEAEAEAHQPGLSAADSAVVREAIRGLRTLYELQGDHLASHGGYTRNLTDPATADYLAEWRDPGARHYRFVVSGLTEGHLCIDAVPRSPEGASLPVSIDGIGVVYAGQDCRGAVISEDAGEEWLEP